MTVLALVLRGEAADQPSPVSTWQAHPSGTAAIETWSNLDAAAHPDTAWRVLAEVAVDFCRGAAATSEQGWLVKGRSVFGRPDTCQFETATGAFNPASSIAANRHTRLANLYYWHHWNAGRYQLKLGRLAIDDDFMISEFAAPLLHSAFGAMPSQVSTPLSDEAGYAVYPLAAPGVWFSATPGPQFSGQGGVYSGSSGLDTSQNHGWEVEHSDAAGVVMFSEIKWQRDRLWPAIYLGASYHTGKHDNYEALLHGRTEQPIHGVWNGYAMVDAALIRLPDGSTRLGGFARAGVSPQRDRSTVSRYLDGGLTWFGPVPGRPHDLLALGLCTTAFESPYRQLAGLHATETTVELTYRCQLTARCAFQADIQRLHPAGVSPPSGLRVHSATSIVGARLLAQF